MSSAARGLAGSIPSKRIRPSSPLSIAMKRQAAWVGPRYLSREEVRDVVRQVVRAEAPVGFRTHTG